MSVVQSICTSFKVELLKGVHDFTPITGDVFKFALYDSGANLNALTTAYSPTGEISSTGAYSAGGVVLTPIPPTADGTTALVSFANLSILAQITASGGMIYNSSKDDRAVAVLDFGGDRTSSAGTFVIAFPQATASSAVIRIG